MDMMFFTLICWKKLYCLIENTKIKQKEAGIGLFLKKEFRKGFVSIDIIVIVYKVYPTFEEGSSVTRFGEISPLR